MVLQKITRYILMIGIILGIGFSFLRTSLYAEEVNDDFHNVKEISKTSYDLENIKKVITKDDFKIFKGKDHAYLIDSKGQLVESFLLNLNNFLILENKIYLVGENKVLLYDFKETKELILENTIVNDIKAYNDSILLVGIKNNDGWIGEISKELNLTNETLMGGDGYEEFKDCFIKDGIIYIIGLKDAVSNNSPFKNVGLQDTKKVFIFTYNTDILNDLYLNSSSNTEDILNVIYDDYIYLLLDSNYMYQIDYDLNLLPVKKISYKCSEMFLDINHQLNYVYYLDNQVFVNNHIFYNAANKILKLSVNNGYIDILESNQLNIIDTLFTEYHIYYLNDLVISKYNQNYEDFDNLSVKSYAEKIDISIKESSPFLEKQIDGLYDITYLLKGNLTKEEYLIKGKLIIKPFVNILKEGIYKAGKILNFYGQAKLNDKEIYNGYKITKPGDYNLTLTNANGISTNYHFLVLDDYYKDDECVTFKADYSVLPNEKIDLIFYLDHLKDINYILINNQEYNSFDVINSELKIHLFGKKYYSIDYYHLQKIVFTDGTSKDFNRSFIIKTLKPFPKINIYQTSKNASISINYDLDDEYQTIMYLKRETISKSKVTATDYFYFDKAMEVKNQEGNQFRYLLVLNDGENIKEINLCEFKLKKGKLKNNETLSFKKDLKINNLNLDLDVANITLEKLNINNKDILSNIEILNSNVSLKLIILISISIIFITTIVIFIKKKFFSKSFKKVE